MTGFERATLWWAKIAVLLSGLAAIFVCAQWYEMHTGGQDTHTLAGAAQKQAEKAETISGNVKRAADQMERSANQAETAAKQNAAQSKSVLDASIAVSRLDQRAWLSPDIITIDREPTETDKATNTNCFRVRMPINNTGKTPALETRAFFDLRMGDRIPDPPRWAESKSERRQVAKSIGVDPRLFDRSSTIFPGHALQTSISGPQCMSPTWVDDYKAHRKFVVVWARISYSDVFGGHHWTQLCAVHVFPDASNPAGFPIALTGMIPMRASVSPRHAIVYKSQIGPPLHSVWAFGII